VSIKIQKNIPHIKTLQQINLINSVIIILLFISKKGLDQNQLPGRIFGISLKNFLKQYLLHL